MRRVLLVDDHPVVRQGIARILTTSLPGLQIAEAMDGPNAVAQLHAAHYDLMLLDLTLPGESGLSLLRRLRRDFAAVPIVVVSMHPADQFAVRALQAGASGYVAKDSDPDEVVRAVSTALQGGRHLPAELHEDARVAEKPPPHGALSDREYQVLRMIGGGRTVSEIAVELGLSVKTVSTYRARILVKLQLRTSAELIHYAVVNKLVT